MAAIVTPARRYLTEPELRAIVANLIEDMPAQPGQAPVVTEGAVTDHACCDLNFGCCAGCQEAVG